MAELKIDPQRPIDIDIRAESPEVFSFTAQYRAPGHDYVDFASPKDAVRANHSSFTIELDAPIKRYTDLRIYFLVGGPSSHPFRIIVQCSQNGHALGQPIVCAGTIAADGKIAFKTAEATFI
ncbi:MAG TPA: hypothetical protein VGG76_07655 [Gemmatimonadaceae bacterium]